VKQGTLQHTIMTIGESMTQQKCEHTLEIQNTWLFSPELNPIEDVSGLLKDRVWKKADEIESNE
jgi:hypothetical protein